MKIFLEAKDGAFIEDAHGTKHTEYVGIPEYTKEDRYGNMEVVIHVYKSIEHIKKKELRKIVYKFSKEPLSIPIPELDENGDVKVDENKQAIYLKRPKMNWDLGVPELDENGDMIMVNQEEPHSHIGSVGIMANMYHMEEVNGEFILIYPKNFASKMWILNQYFESGKADDYFQFPKENN